MRILVILLLLINIGFFVWQLNALPWLPWQPDQFKPQTTPATDSTDPNLLELVLLEEAPQLAKQTPEDEFFEADTDEELMDEADSVAEFADEAIADEEPAETPTEIMVEAAEEGIEEQAIEAALNAANEDSPNPPDSEPTHTKATEETEGLLTASHSPDNDNVEVIEVPPTTEIPSTTDLNTAEPAQTAESSVVEADDLTLLANPATNEALEPTLVPTVVAEVPAIAEAETTTTTETEVFPVIPAVTCFEAGPYTQAKTVETAVQWFNQQPEAMTARVQDRPIQIPQTWVYLPPFTNRQAAQQATTEMRQKNITDHAIITQGQYNNAISLGLYRDQLSVVRRLRELEQHGYTDVKTEKRYQDDTRYWLSVTIPASQQQAILKRFYNHSSGPVLTVAECK